MWDWDLDDWFEFNKQQKAEMDRIHNLGKTPEQIQKEKEELERRKNPQPPQMYNDPTGLIIYILVMIVGVIFVDRWLIWIAATIIYFGSKR